MIFKKKPKFSEFEPIKVKGREGTIVHQNSAGFWEVDFDGIWISVQENLIEKQPKNRIHFYFKTYRTRTELLQIIIQKKPFRIEFSTLPF